MTAVTLEPVTLGSVTLEYVTMDSVGRATSSAGGRPTLLAVAHGSRSEAGNAAARELVARVRELAPELEVRLAFIDDASPSPARALEDLAGAGVEHVVVLPLLVHPGVHSKSDLPGSVQAGRGAHPRMTIHYGAPLGPHARLLRAAEARLAEAGVQASDGTWSVVLAAAGSADPDGNAELARTARLLWEGRRWPYVEAAFVGAGIRPDVGEALDRLHRLGAERIAVLPYLIGSGQFASAIADAVAMARSEVRLVEPLGAHDEVARTVLDRYEEALAGAVRAGCDTCMYRLPFPGRDRYLGQPQQPHSHPDDQPRLAAETHP
jgi:sirohydrochlorin cobaltochelatase